jgi:hypothetical protein
MIAIRVDVDLIDKKRFYKGKKGRYLDLILFESKNNKYGDDYIVKQSMTKEELESGRKPDLPILGNGKILGSPKGGSRSKGSDTSEGDDW